MAQIAIILDNNSSDDELGIVAGAVHEQLRMVEDQMQRDVDPPPQDEWYHRLVALDRRLQYLIGYTE